MAEAKKNVPVDTGTLRRAIYMKQIREASDNSKQTYYVGVRRGKSERKKNRDGYHFAFVEFGTAKMAARPFMRPAFEAKKVDAVEIIKKRLAERVEKLAREK
jgi:HK97 gp10 family phage protein